MGKHILTVLFSFLSMAMSAQPSINVDRKKMNELLPKFFFQSFNVSPITKEAFNSIGVCYTGEGKLVYVSDRPFITLPSVNNRYRAFVFDMVSNETSRLDTRNLCDIDNNNFNIAGL